MAHAHAIANSETKPEFTDYTVAGTDVTRFNAFCLATEYKAERADIEAKRQRRPSIAKQMAPTAQAAKRCGYPKRRQRNDDMPSNRGVPHSKFLKRFKIIERLVGTGFGDWVWVAKVYVLHATRGWKLYA